jgi:iron complex transport system substrate-binding protein
VTAGSGSTRAHLANAVALVGALVLSVVGGYDPAPRSHGQVQALTTVVSSARRHPLPGGGFGIADASGHLVPLRSYQRIVSTNILSDRLLLELCEPERVLAVGPTSAKTSPGRWRFAGKQVVDGMGPLEAIIALKPDLVLMNVFGSDGRTEKLRSAGIEVFNLGQLHGLATLLPTAEVVGELLGDAERGRQWAHQFAGRIDRVAAPLGSRPRLRAIYLAVIAGHIIGGSRGTSYHDVLTHAGLLDAAAAAGYTDWPQFRAEQVVALDPDVIVTKDGMTEAVCGHPGFEPLRACKPGAAAEARVLTLPEAILEDPGVGMLEASERLFELAYPDVRDVPIAN